MGATKTFRSMNDRIDELVNNPLIAHDVRRFATRQRTRQPDLRPGFGRCPADWDSRGEGRR